MPKPNSEQIDLSAPFIEGLSQRQRFARMLILSLFAVALTGGLVITQINVKRGLIVYSDEHETRFTESTMVIRVEGRSLPFRQPIHLTTASIRLKNHQGHLVLTQALKPALESMWQGQITLPKEAGEYTLLVDAEGFEHPSATHGKIAKAPTALNAKTTIKVVKGKANSSLLPPLAQTPTTARERLGVGTLSFYPFDQMLSSELPSDLALIAQDEQGKPWQGEAKLKLLEGLLAQKLPARVRFNQHGFAQLSVIPRSLSLRMRAQALIQTDLEANSEVNSINPTEQDENENDDEWTSTDERFSPRAHQFNLIPKTNLVSSNGLVAFEVQSTYNTDQLYVDLWCGNQWLSTQSISMHEVRPKQKLGGLKSFGQGTIHLPELNSKQIQLLWLQAYQLPYQVDEVRGGAYLLAVPQDFDRSKTVTWLKELVQNLKVEPSGYWDKLQDQILLSSPYLRILLGRLARLPASPSVLINSGLSAELTAKKQRARYMILYFEFMAALCFVTMLWLITLVLLTYRRQITSSEWSDEGSVQQARRIALTWIAPMMIILMVFFGAMILLVFKINW